MIVALSEPVAIVLRKFPMNVNSGSRSWLGVIVSITGDISGEIDVYVWLFSFLSPWRFALNYSVISLT